MTGPELGLGLYNLRDFRAVTFGWNLSRNLNVTH
jgi:hypothetical protein